MSSVLFHPADPRLQPSRTRLFWVVLGALVAGQLFAFWLLCTHQVRKAEARGNEALAHRLALADCLQYIPGSTIASCSARRDPVAARSMGAAAVANAPSGAMPVSYSYR